RGRAQYQQLERDTALEDASGGHSRAQQALSIRRPQSPRAGRHTARLQRRPAGPRGLEPDRDQLGLLVARQGGARAGAARAAVPAAAARACRRADQPDGADPLQYQMIPAAPASAARRDSDEALSI